MPGTFAGKYAFRSTNTTGNVCYLTSYIGESTIYPSVSGELSDGDLTDSEKVILYAQPDGGYVVVLVVPPTLTSDISLAYLKGQPDLGCVVTGPTSADAQELRISPLGAESGTWSIYDTSKGAWTTLRYTPAAGNMAVLRYGDRPVELTTLQGVPVTPSYADLVATKKGQNADLRYVDLTSLDFSGVDSGVDFTGANFTGANLTNAKFRNATLRNAVFTNATMTGVDLTGAKLDGATMSGLNLSSVVWGTGISAQGAHFEYSLFVGSTIGSCSATANLSGSLFTGADLSRADLTGVNLNSAYLSGANLTGATLDSADLTQATLGGSSTDSPAVLACLLMTNGILAQANLFGVNFAGATIYGYNTQLNSAATLEEADFSNAYLEGVSFKKSNLKGARFDGACLLGADFTSAVLMSASFVGACLPGAIFTGAQLAGTNFANAAVSFAPSEFQVRYCTAEGLSDPEVINEGDRTTGLDAALHSTTICPNGSTLAANQALGIGPTAMLTAPGAPTSWSAPACLVPPTAASARPAPQSSEFRPHSKLRRGSSRHA